MSLWNCFWIILISWPQARKKLRRSATPRFALESALIRLATLPKSLPVGELVERLERLEGKFAGAAKPATPMVDHKRCRRLLYRWRQRRRVPQAEWSAEGDSAGVWQAFVGFVGKEKKFLASHLESADALLSCLQAR